MTAVWLNGLLDGATSLLSPGGARGRLSILIYHRVLPAADPMRPGEVHRATFEWHMALLARHFRVLPLREACRALAQGTLPARALAITFDDGYADNAGVALPILQRFGLPATFFVATSFLDGGRMWNDSIIELARRIPRGELDLEDLGFGRYRIEGDESRRLLARSVIAAAKYLETDARADRVAALVDRCDVTLPNDLMLTSDQVRQLVTGGMEVGGHTDRHPILASIDAQQARQEIKRGKSRLEDIVGEPLRLFAYPNGKPGRDYRYEHRELVRELGFEAAVSTHWGAASTASDLYQLPRFTPWHGDALRFRLALMRNVWSREQPGAGTPLQAARGPS